MQTGHWVTLHGSINFVIELWKFCQWKFIIPESKNYNPVFIQTPLGKKQVDKINVLMNTWLYHTSKKTEDQAVKLSCQSWILISNPEYPATYLILIHWWILQKVSKIERRAFSMNSARQATRKKSLSSTCIKIFYIFQKTKYGHTPTFSHSMSFCWAKSKSKFT